VATYDHNAVSGAKGRDQRPSCAPSPSRLLRDALSVGARPPASPAVIVLNRVWPVALIVLIRAPVRALRSARGEQEMQITGLRSLALTLLALAVAFSLGTLIGFERQWRQRSAGLRTTTLVATGAAAFADMGLRLRGVEGATQIIAYIVSGIGFLGAGVILKDGTNIRGLNTAATLWCSAAVGAFSGSGLLIEAVSLTLFVLAGNTLLRPLVNYINRRPMDERATEALYTIHVTCDREVVSDVRDLLYVRLEAANYPIREIETLSEGDDQVELAADLVPTTVEPAELDAVISSLKQSAKIKSATWTVATTA
jgi:putative Mg2+ transporter-C (MgtC) family protein